MAVKHRIRTKDNGITRVVSLTPRSAIRSFCLECMEFHNYEVRKCADELCPLFPFRTKDPTYSKPRKSSHGVVESNGKPETQRKGLAHTKPLSTDQAVEANALVEA